MNDQALHLPETFDHQVRLFPLSDLVTFPSNLLPLHLFESRYREMLEDAVEGDQLITMATLLPGFEHDYYSRPPIASTVCIGRVVAHETTERGTYNLMLQGLQRAHVEHEIEPVRAFRRARVTLIAEHDDDKADRQTRRELVDTVQRTMRVGPTLIKKFRRQNISLSSLTDILAFHLPFPTELKLQLLAEGSVAVRVGLLLKHWPLHGKPDGGNKRLPSDFSQN